jgi:hypothetical protein
MFYHMESLSPVLSPLRSSPPHSYKLRAPLLGATAAACTAKRSELFLSRESLCRDTGQLAVVQQLAAEQQRRGERGSRRSGAGSRRGQLLLPQTRGLGLGLQTGRLCWLLARGAE